MSKGLLRNEERLLAETSGIQHIPEKIKKS